MKKILSLSILVFSLVAIPAFAGDYLSSEEIKKLADKQEVTNEDLKKADLNEDGVIDSQDVSLRKADEDGAKHLVAGGCDIQNTVCPLCSDHSNQTKAMIQLLKDARKIKDDEIIKQFIDLAFAGGIKWEILEEIPLEKDGERFNAHHPQGVEILGNYIYITSVQGGKTGKVGIAHLFVVDMEGNLVRSEKLKLGVNKNRPKKVTQSSMRHPSGPDFDGRSLIYWLSEYKKNSYAELYKMNPHTFKSEFVLDLHLHQEMHHQHVSATLLGLDLNLLETESHLPIIFRIPFLTY